MLFNKVHRLKNFLIKYRMKIEILNNMNKEKNLRQT